MIPQAAKSKVNWEKVRLQEKKQEKKLYLAELDKARSSRKPVLVFLMYSKGKYGVKSESFDRVYFSDAQLAKLASYFHTVKVDLADLNRAQVKQLLKQWKVRRVPCLIAFSADGTRMGDFTRGFPKNLKAWLQGMMKKHQKLLQKKKKASS